MKHAKLIRYTVLFLLAAVMLILPAAAADSEKQADYNLYVYAGAAEQGDNLVIRSGDDVRTYYISTKAVRGLDVADTRSAAGDFAAVAGTGDMMLSVSDPGCEGIRFDGNWNDGAAEDISITFNGNEQEFNGESLELKCELGKLTVNKDGTICFVADADTNLVTISQNNGEASCSVSLSRRIRNFVAESVQKVYLKQINFDKWIGVPLPDGTAVVPENLPWDYYVQFSVANGNLFCRQVRNYPFSATNPAGTVTGEFELVQRGNVTANANWAKDVGNNKRYVRFNGEGHSYGTPDTVTDGTFVLNYDRWYYTSADSEGGSYQFTSQMKGLDLIAAVGRGETPKAVEAGGELLVIESNGRNFTHTMQRLTHAETTTQKAGKLTVHTYIVP